MKRSIIDNEHNITIFTKISESLNKSKHIKDSRMDDKPNVYKILMNKKYVEREITKFVRLRIYIKYTLIPFIKIFI